MDYIIKIKGELIDLNEVHRIKANSNTSNHNILFYNRTDYFYINFNTKTERDQYLQIIEDELNRMIGVNDLDYDFRELRKLEITEV